MGIAVKLELFYLVEKYNDNGSELENPIYNSGPFKSWNEADMHRAMHWLHNNRYVIVKQVLDLEEL
jgi:hypothetical protein